MTFKPILAPSACGRPLLKTYINASTVVLQTGNRHADHMAVSDAGMMDAPELQERDLSWRLLNPQAFHGAIYGVLCKHDQACPDHSMFRPEVADQLKAKRHLAGTDLAAVHDWEGEGGQ